MKASDPPDLIDVIDLGSVHVYVPQKAVMIFGGPYARRDPITPNVPPILSMRDAFLSVSTQDPYHRFAVVIADEIRVHPPIGPYEELLEFEKDIAELCSLVIIFPESVGSFLELGAFAVLPEVAPRLLVVIDDKNEREASFLTLGPILSLQRHSGRHTVFVINLRDLGIVDVGEPANVDLAVLAVRLAKPFRDRLAEAQPPSTLNSQLNGHLAKVIAGLVAHYGALRAVEICDYLSRLGLRHDPGLVDQMLFCLLCVGWIVREPRGHEVYFAYAAAAAPWAYGLQPGSGINSRESWRAALRAKQKVEDPERFEAISAGVGG